MGGMGVQLGNFFFAFCSEGDFKEWSQSFHYGSPGGKGSIGGYLTQLVAIFGSTEQLSDGGSSPDSALGLVDLHLDRLAVAMGASRQSSDQRQQQGVD